MSWDDDKAAAREKAERLELSFYVFNYSLYVLDGGKRAYSGDDQWSPSGEGDSYRRASEEEIEMWAML